MKMLDIVLIGNHSVITECIEQILSLGHQLKSIISQSNFIIKACQQQSIPCFSSDTDIKKSDKTNTLFLIIDAPHLIRNGQLGSYRNIFFINPIILDFVGRSDFFSIIDKIDAIWYQYIPSNKRSFPILINTEKELDDTPKTFFISTFVQFLNQLARSTNTNRQLDNCRINYQIIDLMDLKMPSHEIIAIISTSSYKFFNHDNLHIYSPIQSIYSTIFPNSSTLIKNNKLIFEGEILQQSIHNLANMIKLNLSIDEKSFLLPIYGHQDRVISSSLLEKSSTFHIINEKSIMMPLVLLNLSNIGNHTFSARLLIANTLKDQLVSEQIHASFQGVLLKCQNHIDCSIRDILPCYSTENLSPLKHIKIKNDDDNVVAEKNLYKLFALACKNFPNNIAVSCENKRLTYHQLYNKVDNLVAIISQRSSTSAYIGILFRRNINLIIAILAVLKAGFAYLPLDPKQPIKRLSHIIQLSGISLVLTDKQVSREFQLLTHNKNLTLINLDDIEKTPPIGIHKHKRHSNIAYLIYTSGSTGTPKGVMCSHTGASNMIAFTVRTYPISSTDRVLQLASTMFDMSVWEIFAPLTTGAELVLAKDDGYANPEYIANIIKARQITIAHMIPSVLNYFLDYYDVDQTSLKHVVSGGEELTVAIARKFLEALPTCQLHHGYGPTETAITSLHYTVRKKDLKKSYIPIGRPIDNVAVMIVNKERQSVPIGVKGELYITGKNLAIGYLNDRERTQNSFLNIEIDGKYKIFYKTGDLVVHMRDGLIRYIGRIDNQIKIRGNRVELEEIEYLLKKALHHDHLAVCVVGKAANRKLLAFIKQEKNSELNKSIQKTVQECLPTYMSIQQVIFIESMPTLSNGKIDRSQLLSLYHLQRISKNHKTHVNGCYDHPAITKLCSYIQSLIKTETFSPEDNFFESGLNSLTITQLCSHIRSEFGISVTPQEAIETKNIVGLSKLIDQKSENGNVVINKITKIPRGTVLPLSHAQQRLWFMHQVEGQNSHAYNIQKYYIISDHLNINALNLALSMVIARHEPLRTLFKSASGRPHQVILSPKEIVLQTYPIEENQKYEKLKAFFNYQFKLDKEPSIKFKLFYVEEKSYYIFCILQHNIITDAWSTGILIKEISKFYNDYHHNNFLKKERNLSIQYADYAVWQNKAIEADNYNHQLAYWREALDDFEELQFPLDFERSCRQTFHGKTCSIRTSDTSINTIHAICRKQQITLYSYLIATLTLTLHYYTNQQDLVIGSAVASRNDQDINNTIGFFVNILPLRTKVRNKISICQYLLDCHKNCMAMLSNQDIPFDVLVEKLGVEREPNRSPIFQVLFIMQDIMDNTIFYLDGVEIEEGRHHFLDIATFDITFNVFKSNNFIEISCQYNSELFKNDHIIAFLEHYKKNIEDIPNWMETSINDYPFLTNRDKEIIQLCNTTNDNEYENTNHNTIYAFQKVACEFQEKVALVDTENQLTYKQLLQKVSALSSMLDKNISPISEVTIGIYMDKSIPFITAMLAIMATKATYVPLDPNLPEERLMYMIHDAKIRYLVSSKHQKLSKKIRQQVDHIFYFDEIPKDQSMLSLASCKVVNNDQLVYIIFTSGSTGMPKGVRICHSNLINLLQSFQKIVNFTHQDTFLSVTSSTFDIFQLECLLPLTNGGTCVLHTMNDDSESSRLFERIVTTKPTHIQATPSTWQLVITMLEQWINSHQQYNLSNIVAITGGEALQHTLLLKMQQLFSKVLNVYGPTETTIWSTVADLSENNSVHIGRPIAHTQCYVVNKNNKIMPVNCYGELWISGRGVGKGYGELEKTQASFVNSTLNILPSPTTFYKTGDIVKLGFDGNLYYATRKDKQVKIRGYRIELEEINYTLLITPFIKQAVTLAIHAVGTSDYDKILISFIVLNPSYHLEAIEQKLLNICRDKLPRYMIPNKLIALDNIPLTINDKIDTFRLESLFHNMQSTIHNNDHSNKLNKTERLLTLVWCELLQIQLIDIDQTFYQLGGHSLLIPVLLHHLIEKHGWDITVRKFVEHPTIRSLAHYINHTFINKKEEKINATIIHA